MRDPASAAKLFAELREADPLTALRDLSAWLEEAKDISGDHEKVRGDILALIQEAGDVHVFKLLAQFIARQSDQQAARESTLERTQPLPEGTDRRAVRDRPGTCSSKRKKIRRSSFWRRRARQGACMPVARWRSSTLSVI